MDSMEYESGYSSTEEIDPCTFYTELNRENKEYIDPSCLPAGLRLSINRKTKLDLLTEKIERPNGGIPPNHLPMWPKYPLGQKLPNITAPCGIMYYSKGKIGENLERNYLDWHADEFCLIPSHNYSALHDPYVANYFIKPTVINQLAKLGLITKDGHVVCTLKELNVYRKYLDTVFKDKVKEMIKDKDRAWLCNFKVMRKIQQYNRTKDPEIYKSKVNQAKMLKKEEYYKRLLNLKEKQRQEKDRAYKRRIELKRQYLENMILSKEKEEKVALRKLELENLEKQHRERIMNHIICKEKTSEVRRLTLRELMKDAYNRYLKEFIDAKWESQNQRLKCEEIIERSIREDLKTKAAYRQSFMENQWNIIPKIIEKRSKREERRMNLARKYFYIWLIKTSERRIARNLGSSWDIENSIKNTNTQIQDKADYEVENMKNFVWRVSEPKMNSRKVPNRNSLNGVAKDKISKSHRSNRRPRDKTFVPESCHTHKTITSLAERKNAARVEAETITAGMRDICTSELNQGNAVVLKIPIGQLICPDNEMKQIKILKSQSCAAIEKIKIIERPERKSKSPKSVCSNRKLEPRFSPKIRGPSPGQKQYFPTERKNIFKTSPTPDIVRTPPTPKTNVKTPPAKATRPNTPKSSKTASLKSKPVPTLPKEPIQLINKTPEKIIHPPLQTPKNYNKPEIERKNIFKNPNVVKPQTPTQEDDRPKILPKSPEKSPIIEKQPEIKKITPSEPSVVTERFSEPVIEEKPTTPEKPKESDEPTEKISEKPSEPTFNSPDDKPKKENPQTPEVKSSEKLLIEPSGNIPKEPSSDLESPKEPEKSESPKKPIEPERRESLKIEPQIESIEEEPSEPETDEDSLKPVKSTGESPKKPSESEINIPSNIESPPVSLSEKPSQFESEAPEKPSNEDFQEPIEEKPKVMEPQEVHKEPSQDDLKDPSEPEIIKEPIEPEELSPIIEPNDHPNEENEQEERKLESPAEEPNKPKENVLKTPSQEEPKQTEPEATEDEPIKELSKKPSIENAPTQPKSKDKNPPEALNEELPSQQPVKEEPEEEKPENIPSEDEEPEEVTPEINELSPDEPIEGKGKIPPVIPCKDDEPCCTDSEIDQIANDLVRHAIERERQKLKDQICPGCTNDEIDSIANRLVRKAIEKERDKLKVQICSGCTDDEIDSIANRLVRKAIEKERDKLKDLLNKVTKAKDTCEINDLLNEENISPISSALVRRIICQEYKKLCPDKSHVNLFSPNYQECVEDIVNQMAINAISKAIKDVKIDKKGTIIAHQVLCDSIRELNKDDGLNENLQNTEINIELERLKKKCCTKSCIIEEECIDLRSICMTDEAIEKAVEKQKQIVYEKTLKEIQEYIKNETANSSSSSGLSGQSSTQILIPERPQLSSKCESGEITPTQSEFKEMISKDNKEAEEAKQNSQSQAQPENSSDIDRRDTKTQIQALAEQVALLRKDFEAIKEDKCKKDQDKASKD